MHRVRKPYYCVIVCCLRFFHRRDSLLAARRILVDRIRDNCSHGHPSGHLTNDVIHHHKFEEKHNGGDVSIRAVLIL